MSLWRKLFGGGGDAGGAATATSGSELIEASMNFDLENVRPFLERLRDRRGIGFDVDALAEFATGTPVNDERQMQVAVLFADRPVDITYSVFMDDIDAPDLYFFCKDQPLIDAINAEWEDFTEELGI